MTTLYHTTAEGNIPFTEEEVAEYEAMQLAFMPDYSSNVQSLLDSTATELGYDNALSIVSYDGDSNEQFAADAAKFKTWRSLVWSTHNTLVNEIKVGIRDKIDPAEFLTLLPAFPT